MGRCDGTYLIYTYILPEVIKRTIDKDKLAEKQFMWSFALTAAKIYKISISKINKKDINIATIEEFLNKIHVSPIPEDYKNIIYKCLSPDETSWLETVKGTFILK